MGCGTDQNIPHSVSLHLLRFPTGVCRRTSPVLSVPRHTRPSTSPQARLPPALSGSTGSYNRRKQISHFPSAGSVPLPGRSPPPLPPTSLSAADSPASYPDAQDRFYGSRQGRVPTGWQCPEFASALSALFPHKETRHGFCPSGSRCPSTQKRSSALLRSLAHNSRRQCWRAGRDRSSFRIRQ